MSLSKGRCLCGDVSFEVHATPQEPCACHCSQCRRQSGNYWATAYVATDEIEIKGKVAWYEASPAARRGFCPRCGSFLFWKAHGEDTINFALGALDQPTGLRLQKHIFTADKGDYYDIADGVPQREQS